MRSKCGNDRNILQEKYKHDNTNSGLSIVGGVNLLPGKVVNVCLFITYCNCEAIEKNLYILIRYIGKGNILNINKLLTIKKGMPSPSIVPVSLLRSANVYCGISLLNLNI